MSVSEVIDWPDDTPLWNDASPRVEMRVRELVLKGGLLAGSLAANLVVWYGIGSLVAARVG